MRVQVDLIYWDGSIQPVGAFLSLGRARRQLGLLYRERDREIPTIEGSRDIDDALAKLESFLSGAAANRFVAGALGLRNAQPRRPQPPSTVEHVDRAKAELARFESMPSEEIERQLADESLYSARELRAMASVIGIGSTKGTDRAGLAHRIASKIINYRGYRSLGEPVR